MKNKLNNHEMETLKEKPTKIKGICPICSNQVENRKNPCPKCGYNGYFPIPKEKADKIRNALFIVGMVIFVLVVIAL